MEDYSIGDRLGAGGQGDVFKATHKATGKEVAIKVMRCKDQKEVDTALKEVKVLIQLRHAYIVHYSDFLLHFDPPGTLQTALVSVCLVMSLCTEGCLGSLIETARAQFMGDGRHPITEARFLKWFQQCAIALQYLHEHGFLHRDLKPANIFLHDDDVNIGDFGVATATSAAQGAISHVGTPHYLAPEVFSRTQSPLSSASSPASAAAGDVTPYDAKVDIWGLGMAFLELATLRDDRAINHEVLVHGERATESIPKDVEDLGFSRGVGQLIRDMLHPDPARRPSAAELLHQIAAVAASSSVLAMTGEELDPVPSAVHPKAVVVAGTTTGSATTSPAGIEPFMARRSSSASPVIDIAVQQQRGPRPLCTLCKVFAPVVTCAQCDADYCESCERLKHRRTKHDTRPIGSPHHHPHNIQHGAQTTSVAALAPRPPATASSGSRPRSAASSVDEGRTDDEDDDAPVRTSAGGSSSAFPAALQQRAHATGNRNQQLYYGPPRGSGKAKENAVPASASSVAPRPAAFGGWISDVPDPSAPPHSGGSVQSSRDGSPLQHAGADFVHDLRQALPRPTPRLSVGGIASTSRNSPPAHADAVPAIMGRHQFPSSSASAAVRPSSPQPPTIFVPSKSHPTLAAALAVALPKTIIRLGEGSQCHDPVVVATPEIAIVGEGRGASRPVIGDGNLVAVRITAPGCRLSNVIVRQAVKRASIDDRPFGILINTTPTSAAGTPTSSPADTATSQQHQRVVIDGCDVSCTSGDSIAVQGANTVAIVSRCTVSGAERTGIVVSYDGRVDVVQCEVSNTDYCGILVRKAWAKVSRCAVRDCAQSGIFFVEAAGSVGEGNTIDRVGKCGLVVKDSPRFALRNNTITEAGQAGMFFCGQNTHGDVCENTVSRSVKANVIIKTQANPVFRRNKVTDGRESGIYIFEGGAGIIEDNAIQHHEDAGIVVASNGAPRVEKNRITHNKKEAVWMLASGRGRFVDNDVRRNGKGPKDISAVVPPGTAPTVTSITTAEGFVWHQNRENDDADLGGQPRQSSGSGNDHRRVSARRLE